MHILIFVPFLTLAHFLSLLNIPLIALYHQLIGKQDPFCVFKVGKTTMKTKTDYRGGQHPIWDFQVNLPVPENEKKMTAQVFDDDKKKEDLIGECEIDLSTVLKDGEQDGE